MFNTMIEIIPFIKYTDFESLVSNSLSQRVVDYYMQGLYNSLYKYRIADKRDIAHFLAQVLGETNHLSLTREIVIPTDTQQEIIDQYGYDYLLKYRTRGLIPIETKEEYEFYSDLYLYPDVEEFIRVLDGPLKENKVFIYTDVAAHKFSSVIPCPEGKTRQALVKINSDLYNDKYRYIERKEYLFNEIYKMEFL